MKEAHPEFDSWAASLYTRDHLFREVVGAGLLIGFLIAVLVALPFIWVAKYTRALAFCAREVRLCSRGAFAPS